MSEVHAFIISIIIISTNLAIGNLTVIILGIVTYTNVDDTVFHILQWTSHMRRQRSGHICLC